MENRRIFLYHPDPWGNGVSCTLCYMPVWDGDIRRYIGSGWVAKYDDDSIVPVEEYSVVEDQFFGKPLIELRFEVIDFSK